MRRPLLVLLLAFAGASAAAQPDPNQAAWDRLGDFVRSRMRESGTPGLSLAVTSRERLLHVGTFGYANVDAKTAVTPDTLFEIGSISKSFTSVALLQLRDEGRFDPRAPITTYLPWFAIKSKYAPVTGHHLMSHTAGFPRDRDDVPSSKYQAFGVRDRETGYEPGVHFAYSNVGYQVLGYALEAAARDAYPNIIEQRILKPLGMHATAAQFTHETRPRIAVGYDRMYDDRPGHPSHPLVPATWLEYAAGDGSIVSTPADMAAYARMLLNRGKGPAGARILSEESFALLTQRAVASGDASWYGYGMGTSERDGRTIVSHSGGMVGYSSMLMMDPAAGVGAVVLLNGPGDPGGVAAFALEVARAALAGDPLPAVPPPDDPLDVEKASDYAGTYGAGPKALTVRADGRRLWLGSVPLERRGRDAFLANDPAFDRFLLRFEREQGAITGLAYGGDWRPRAGRPAAPAKAHPPEWDAYAGHYRTTHAWFNNFRIVVRRGTLYLVTPAGSETMMEPLSPALFKEEGKSAERLRFDSIVDGQALRANLSGVDYYRVFTK